MEGNFLRIRNDFCESVSLRVSEESPPPVSRGPRGVPTGVPCGVPRGVPACNRPTTLKQPAIRTDKLTKHEQFLSDKILLTLVCRPHCQTHFPPFCISELGKYITVCFIIITM
jgi:hypothetical protein